MPSSLKPTYAVVKDYEVSSCAGETIDDLWKSCIEKRPHIGNDGFGKLVNSNYKKQGDPKIPLIECIKKILKNQKVETLNQDIGVILATTTGYTATWENLLLDYLGDDSNTETSFDLKAVFSKEPLGYLLEEIKDELQIKGPSAVISTACSASTHSLGLAQQWVKLKKVEKCLVITVELLCLLTKEGFNSFNLLDKTSCKPFDKERTGINLSEAVGCVYIEAQETINDDEIQIAGFGATTDIHQMTTPDPEGKGTAQSMQMAISSANLNNDDIDLIHTHGTASYFNDLAEAMAIKTLWSASDHPPFISTKGVHGHTLGASGLLESCILFKAMKENLCPPTTGFNNFDNELGIKPLSKPLEKKLNCVLKNTLGFGGANASLVFKRGA